MKPSNISYFFLGLATVITASAVFFWMRHPKPDSRVAAASASPNQSAEIVPNQPGLNDSMAPQAPDQVLANPGVGASSAEPVELIGRIAHAFAAGDLAKVGALMGKDALDSQTIARLKALFSSPIRLRQPDGIREVGEMELNQRSRWSIQLEGPQAGSIFVDLRRVGGKWSVEKMMLPSSDASEPSGLMDPLGVADAFIQTVLKQNFDVARAHVDAATVSDAKIAGLCILFEEGQYQLRKAKPLRSMFQRQDTVGYLANVETRDGKQSAQFSMTLKQKTASGSWIVSEINLDQLLADYASRVAGGDLYYSPLIRNPNGGDTLALYFEFDEDQMHPRTRRQLEIVGLILKSDTGKKITLSGHTDALGTKDYNNDLSSRRADIVRDFLIKAGVASSQILTVAKGDSQPRRPNVTEAGGDNPDGRRANRRTEIYLDF